MCFYIGTIFQGNVDRDHLRSGDLRQTSPVQVQSLDNVSNASIYEKLSGLRNIWNATRMIVESTSFLPSLEEWLAYGHTNGISGGLECIIFCYVLSTKQFVESLENRLKQFVSTFPVVHFQAMQRRWNVVSSHAAPKLAN